MPAPTRPPTMIEHCRAGQQDADQHERLAKGQQPDHEAGPGLMVLDETNALVDERLHAGS